MKSFIKETLGGNLLEHIPSGIIQMGRFASKKNNRGPDIDTSGGRAAGFWTFILTCYIVAFFIFQSQLSSVVVINFIVTLGGNFSWSDAVVGFYFILVFIACIQLGREDGSFLSWLVFIMVQLIILVTIGGIFTSQASQFVSTAVSLAGLMAVSLLAFIGGKYS